MTNTSAIVGVNGVRCDRRVCVVRRRLSAAGVVGACAALCFASVSLADGARSRATPTNSGVGGGSGVVVLEDPDSPEARAQRERQGRRVATARELKQHRAKYFRGIRNVQIRQVGMDGLRQYADPSAFPMMLEIFGGEGDEVVGAMLDHLLELDTDEADSTVAWAAVFGDRKALRDAAMQRIEQKYKGDVEQSEHVPTRLQSVVAIGLRRNQPNAVVNRAAKLADVLGLVQAIPMLIQAQARGSGTRVGSGGGNQALGWILVGTQQAFIADLVPVVGDSAVAFDPTIGVVTEGAVLQINGAVTITYLVEVNAALNRLASDAWGHRTEYLGWNQLAWHSWYNNEFAPYWSAMLEQRRQSELAAAEAAAAKTQAKTESQAKANSQTETASKAEPSAGGEG